MVGNGFADLGSQLVEPGCEIGRGPRYELSAKISLSRRIKASSIQL